MTCEKRSASMNRSTWTVPGAADAREVVAAEVDEHHVLGAVLLRREQPLGVALARAAVVPAIGFRLARRALDLDERLRRRADQGEVAELEQEEVRRRVDAAERPVELERARRGRPLGALREDDLEGVAGADVLLRREHAALVLRAVRGSAGSSRRAAGPPEIAGAGASSRARSSSGSPQSTSREAGAWSKRTSVSATTKRLSGRSGPSPGAGRSARVSATWS